MNAIQIICFAVACFFIAAIYITNTSLVVLPFAVVFYIVYKLLKEIIH